jgi:hypothetical protein
MVLPTATDPNRSRPVRPDHKTAQAQRPRADRSLYLPSASTLVFNVLRLAEYVFDQGRLAVFLKNHALVFSLERI